MIRDSFYNHIQFVKRYSFHTLDAYKTDLRQFETYLATVYEVSDEKDVSPAMVRSWLASLIDAGISARSVNRKISSLKAYFHYLLSESIIQQNPVSKTIALKTPSRLPVYASQQQMEVALSRQEPIPVTFNERRDLLVMEILYCTGIRRAELISLSIEDVNLEKQTIKVTGKRNKQRIIPLLPELCGLIREYMPLRGNIALPGVKEIILTNQGKKAYPLFIHRIVERYLALAGIKGRKSPHILRHTFASHLLNEGADLNAIKELLGHTSLAATQVYTHVSIEKLKSIYKLAHPRA